MNENEMNVQNIGNNQPVDPNVNIASQPNNMNINGEIPNTVPQNVGVEPQQQMQPRAQMPGGNIGIGENQAFSSTVELQPINNENVEMPVQPASNFMEDFSQAVVSEPTIENVSPMMSEVVPENPMATPVSNASVTPMAPTPVTGNIEPTPISNDIPVTAVPIETETQAVVSDPVQTNEANQVTEAEGKPVKKKKGNWAFIIALFAVVGFFVLLLPLLVRIFGY